jgi:ACR3 family arsenite transporter
MAAGVLLGKMVPALANGLRGLEFGAGSQINIPIAVLIWLMITPMMMKVDFASIRHIGRRPRGLFVTLFVNWLVKPFSMAAFAWLFFRYLFAAWIPTADADQYIAGCIILAAAPCTAMVFVWSHLSDGDPAYTLVQVSVNDLIMLVLFAPIVRFLVSGASSLQVPFIVLLYSVIIFIVVAWRPALWSIDSIRRITMRLARTLLSNGLSARVTLSGSRWCWSMTRWWPQAAIRREPNGPTPSGLTGARN